MSEPVRDEDPQLDPDRQLSDDDAVWLREMGWLP